MLTYPKTSTITSNATSVRNPARSVLPSVNRGSVSVLAERKHLSMIVYGVPGERVRALLPDSFRAEETIINGRAMAWVTVESFFDQSAAGQPAFEQTDYFLHVLRDGRPGRWLLGTSLGSLAAVGARNLWTTPWHLSAMEFRVAYDRSKGRYREHSLQTQSQWVNSAWRISDTGQAIDPETFDQADLPASIFGRDSTAFFARRDGSIGARRIVRLGIEFTRGEVRQAECDLLERLRLLTREELMHPAFVTLQHNARCQLFPATVPDRRQPFEYDRPRLAYAS
ncbi:MAG: DUF2071 domain-containing protein [Acidobacteriota bacterium]